MKNAVGLISTILNEIRKTDKKIQKRSPVTDVKKQPKISRTKDVQYLNFKTSRILQYKNSLKIINKLKTVLFLSIPLDLLISNNNIFSSFNTIPTLYTQTLLALFFLVLCLELPLTLVKSFSHIISLQTKNNSKFNKYITYGLPAFAILVAFIEVFSRLKIQSLRAGIFWFIIFGVGTYKFINDIVPTLKTSVPTKNSSDNAKKSGEFIPPPILSFYSMTMIVIVNMFLLARICSPLLLNGQSGYLIAISSLLLLILAKVNLDKVLALELVFCTNCGLFKTSIDKKLIRCSCQIETSGAR